MLRSRRFAAVLVALLGLSSAAASLLSAQAEERRGPQFLLAMGTGAPQPIDMLRTPTLRARINLDLQDVTLDEALGTVVRRSGLRLVYSAAVADLSRRVSLRADRITVAAALTDLLFDANVDVLFADGGRRAVLTKRNAVAAAVGSVVGRVTDAKTGTAVAGADVSLEGTRWRGTTDGEGRYRLVEVAPGNYSVLARRIGYAPERRAVTVAAGQEATADVALHPSATRLGDVVVTAQKREERLQDVPLSVAVVTPEEIDRRGLVSAEDYLRGIPGVNQVTQSVGQAIVIRGIESAPAGSQNFWQGTSFATYFGETPTTNSGGLGFAGNADLKLVDIERVEVLRGPQGTAFGNSSLGGSVRTIPVAPKLDRVEGRVASNYSVTSGTGGDNYMIQGVANFPLIKDRLALRATGYRFEESGFYRSVAGSDPTFQSTVVAPFGAQAYATDEEEVGASRFTGGRIAALFQASDALKFTLSYLKQKTEIDGQNVATTGVYEQTVLQVADPEHVHRGQRGGVYDTDIDLASAMLEYDLGWANLLATYSYVTSRSMFVLPFTGIGVPWPLSFDDPSKHRAHSGEIRVATQLDGAWNFLGGLYVEDLADEVSSGYVWHGSPETNFFGARSLGEAGQRRNLTQKAAFAEVSWEFLPSFTLTGGVRVYDYDRTIQFFTTSPGAFVGPVGTGPEFGGDASGTSFRGNLSHKLTENALVYAGWSQGFRLGRPTGPGLSGGVCDLDSDGIIDGTSVTVESTTRVRSDNVDNYELGGKFTLLDRRLMIAADVFRIDWTDFPALLRAPCSFGFLANAGDARSEGIEFQANFYVTDAFRVDVGGSWIRARIMEDVPALNAFKDARLPGSPEVNANLGLQYEFNIGGANAFVRADPIYVGPFYSNLQETAASRSGGYVKVDASTRVAVKHLDIDLFVRNLTNRNDYTFSDAFGLPFGYRLRPRTVGLQLSRNF